MFRFLIFLIVLLPTSIAALLFIIAHALFTVPDVLFGAHQKMVAVLCAIGGGILLVPAMLAIGFAIINLLGKKKTK